MSAKRKNKTQERKAPQPIRESRNGCREAFYNCLEELRLKADYIAGLCDALILAQLTGDSAENPETGEALARMMQRNLNGLYSLIELAQDGLAWKVETDPSSPSGSCKRLADAFTAE